ncbi:MAG: hypothetical protein CL610_15070 [Anaerolineaceae bacterium]|nr:hypothetical protein [Anaerolineaceae bacterium]
MAHHDRLGRSVKLVDIPQVTRLLETGTILDSEQAFTGGVDLSSAALISSFVLPHRSVYTMLARSDKQTVVGQFRLQPDRHKAHIVYIAPGLDYEADNTAWLNILDAMTAEAGRRGAHVLTAEVDEHLNLFETMRVTGFSIYARQEIWQRPPGPLPNLPVDKVDLTCETEADAHGVQLLYSNIVPRLVQQAAAPPIGSNGLVYRKNDRVEGYIAVSEGRAGIYLMPYLHPDVFSEAAAILVAAIDQASRSHQRVPVYVAVRRYQDWLEDALVGLGFEAATRQAVMVRHIAAGVRQASFAPLIRKLETVPSPIKPPTATTKPIVEKFNEE